MTLECKHLLIAAMAAALVLAAAGAPAGAQAAAASVAASRPATQPGKTKPPTRAPQRVKLLKGNLDSFGLHLSYLAVKKEQSAGASFSTWKGVASMPKGHRGGVRISKAQASAIIDYLDRTGLLARMLDPQTLAIIDMHIPIPHLHVRVLAGKCSFENWLPIDPKAVELIEALGKLLDGDAAKAMDKVLKAVEPYRKMWRRQKAASFVKRLKASKRRLNLVLWYHPVGLRDRNTYPNLHLLWMVPAGVNLPSSMIVMSRREAMAAIDALDKAGYFERAGNITWRRAARMPSPWPVHKGPCYSLTISSDNLDCHANLGWDLKMLECLDALWKAFGKASDAAKAMDKVLKALEPQRKKWQRPAKRAETIRRMNWFELQLEYHGKAKRSYVSLRFYNGPARPMRPLNPWWESIGPDKKQVDAIVGFLLADGYLERALDVSRKTIAPAAPCYTLKVRCGEEHLYEGLGWDLKTLHRLGALRKVLTGNAAKAMDKLLKALEPHRKEWEARAQRDVKRRRVCIMAMRKMHKDFAALAAKYPKELGHLGPGTIDEKKLLLRFPVKNLPKATQPARRATPAGRMWSVPRRLRPDELGLFVQFTVPMPISDFPTQRPVARWLYSNVGLSWWWMWPNRSFSSKAQQGFLNMLSQALVPLNELENAAIAADLGKRGKGAYVLRGRPGVKLTLRLAPKNAAGASPTIDLYATNQTKQQVVPLCPPFTQIIGDGKPWHYRAHGSLPMLTHAFGSGKDPFIHIKPGQTAKVGAAVVAGLSAGRHTVRVAAGHPCDYWVDMRPTFHDGPPVARKVTGAWTGVLVSGEMTIDIPTPAAAKKKAAERAKLLKKTGTLYLVLQYHVGFIGARPSLHLATTNYKIDVIGGNVASLTPKEAANIIDHLAKEGFLAQAENVVGKDIAPPQGPAYTLTLMGAGQTKLYQVPGWDLKMLGRLDALRKVLDKGSAAGKAMDKLLKALEPQRKKWQKAAAGKPPAKPAVKWGKAVGGLVCGISAFKKNVQLGVP